VAVAAVDKSRDPVGDIRGIEDARQPLVEFGVLASELNLGG